MPRHQSLNPFDWTRDELVWLCQHYRVGNSDFRTNANKEHLLAALRADNVLPKSQEVAHG